MGREELLKGLGVIRDLIIRINQLADKQVRIESQVRQTISTSGGKQKGRILLTALGIVVLGFDVISGLLRGDYSSLIICAILLFIVIRKPGQKSWLKSIAWAYLALTTVVGVFWMASNAVALVILIVFSTLAIAVILSLIKVKNQEINNSNAALRKAYAATIEPMKQLQQALRAQCSRIRYPVDYLDLNAVEFFIHGIKNYRANSLGQMVNLYEATKDRQRTIALQQQQLRLAEQSNYNQAQILGELRYSNALQLFNLSPRAQDSFGFSLGYWATTALFK